MISEELVENMRSWKHSGFSVHCGKPIEACDANGRKTLSEYISRAPFSLERMSFNEHSHTVLYRGEHFHPTLARNFDVSEPLEWIARITSHIPKKGAKQVISFIEQPFVIRRILKHIDPFFRFCLVIGTENPYNWRVILCNRGRIDSIQADAPVGGGITILFSEMV